MAHGGEIPAPGTSAPWVDITDILAPGQPECSNADPHEFHNHRWMDQHFKEHSVWCEGLCPWCFPFFGRRPHGSGEHK